MTAREISRKKLANSASAEATRRKPPGTTRRQRFGARRPTPTASLPIVGAGRTRHEEGNMGGVLWLILLCGDHRRRTALPGSSPPGHHPAGRGRGHRARGVQHFSPPSYMTLGDSNARNRDPSAVPARSHIGFRGSGAGSGLRPERLIPMIVGGVGLLAPMFWAPWGRHRETGQSSRSERTTSMSEKQHAVIPPRKTDRRRSVGDRTRSF